MKYTFVLAALLAAVLVFPAPAIVRASTVDGSSPASPATSHYQVQEGGVNDDATTSQGPQGEAGQPGADGQNGRNGVSGQPGPRGYNGHNGHNGRRGPRGFRGERGPAAGTANHAGIDQDIASWRPASVSFVEARDARLRHDISGSGRPNGGGTPNPAKPEERSGIMAAIIVIAAVLAAVIVGGIVAAAILARRPATPAAPAQFPMGPNNTPGGGSDPHRALGQNVGRAKRVQTAGSYVEEYESLDAITAQADAAVAREQTRAVADACRRERYAAQLGQVVAVYAQPPTQVFVAQPGWVTGGNGPAPAPPAGQRGYTVDELRQLGVIQPPRQQPAAQPQGGQQQPAAAAQPRQQGGVAGPRRQPQNPAPPGGGGNAAAAAANPAPAGGGQANP